MKVFLMKSDKRHDYHDLCDSAIAVVLQKMQREVNVGHPFKNMLHIDESSNHHPNPLHAANDLDGCLVSIHSWRQPSGPEYEEILGQHHNGSVRKFV